MTRSLNYPFLLAGQFLGAFGDNFLLAAILGPLTFQLLGGGITEVEVNAVNALYSAVFFVPFILLAPLAGFLNDRQPKTTWLVGGNLLKLLGALVGAAALWLYAGDPGASRIWQVAGYAIVGLGACVYSPAKYGILPEILPADRLVKANGTVEMLTLVAILGGLWGGAALYDHTRSLPICYLAAMSCYAVAAACNAAMTRTPCNPAATLGRSVKAFTTSFRGLLGHRRLSRVLLGCGLFWFAGAVLRGNLQSWGFETLTQSGFEAVTNQKLALLKVGLIAGIVVGSLLAGQLHRVGDLSGSLRYAAVMAVGVLGLGLIGGRWGVAPAVGLLVLVGLAAGLLLIPLNAALQHESDPSGLGKTIAIQNFVDYSAMLLGAGFLRACSGAGFGPSAVFIALAATLALLVPGVRASSAEPVRSSLS